MKRRNRIGTVDITNTGDGEAVVGTWKDPDTINGSAPVQIELEHAPKRYHAARKTQGGSGEGVTIAVTKTGVTLTPDAATDTSVWRITAYVDGD